MEVEQTHGKLVEAGEVVGGEDFSLHDGEVDLDLVEPTGVYGTVDERQAREHLLESEDGGRAPVRTPIINDPEDAAGIVVWRAGHDLFHQAIEWRDAGSYFAAAKNAGVMDIESGDICPGTAAIVFVLDEHGTIRRGWKRGMVAPPGLNAGLFVGRDDVFVTLEGFAIPATGIQIQYSASLDGKGGITWKDPAAVTPRTNGILMEPPPDGAARDAGHQTGIANLAGYVRSVPAGNRHAMSGRQFTSQSLNLNHQLRGEKPGDDPGGSALPARPGALQRSVYATG